MSLLELSLVAVGLLLTVNLLAAFAVRAASHWRDRRDGLAREWAFGDVALFCAGLGDELPAPRGRHRRRMLREAMLQAALEVSGAAHERLNAGFAALGFADDVGRELRSRRLMTRVRAAEAIGEMRVRESTPGLLEALGDRREPVRRASALALARIGAPNVLRSILEALGSDDEHTNAGDMTEIMLAYGPSGVPELRTLVFSELEPRLRWLVAVVLGELRALEATPELLGCLLSDDDELCARALHALGKIGDSHTAVPLALAVEDQQRPWFVHTAAAGACGRVGSPATAPVLVRALGSEHWHVRSAAASSLVSLGEAGLSASARALAELSSTALLQYWGALDVAEGTRAVIERAAAGERDLDGLVCASARAGAIARLEELAGEDSPVAAYAWRVLRERTALGAETGPEGPPALSLPAGIPPRSVAA